MRIFYNIATEPQGFRAARKGMKDAIAVTAGGVPGARAGTVGEFRNGGVQNRPSQPFLIACATAWVLLRASSFFCALAR